MPRWSAAEILAPTSDSRFRRMVVAENRVRVALLGYAAGDSVHLHAHLESDEIFFVVAGRAIFQIDGESTEVGAGDLLHVGAGQRHSIQIPDEPLVLLAVVAPNLEDAWVAEPGPGDPR